MKKKIITFGLACVFVSCLASAAAEPDYYAVIRSEVKGTAPWLGDNGADWTAKAILFSCAKWNVDPLLAAAVFKQESSFTMTSSPAGAIGIAQLMPDTAAGLGVNPFDPLQNIDGGVHYLRIQLDRFSGNGSYAVTNAVAAYNAGPGAVQQYRGVPPYQETRNYVVRVYTNYVKMMRRC